MLWALVSAKGSPGLTTLAAAMAVGGEALVAELDPAGGDLAARAQVAHEPPGLMSLAAVARRGLAPDMVGEQVRTVGPGIPVLFGPPDAVRATAALTALGADLGRALPRLGGDVLADCGRWGPSSPTAEILAAAVTTVVVLRAEPDQVAHVHAVLPAMRTLSSDVVVVAVARRHFRPVDDIARLLGIDVVGVVEHDADSATGLARATGVQAVRRNALVRSAATILDALRSRSARVRPELGVVR